MQWYYYSWSLYPPQISRSLHLTDTSSIIHLRPLKRSQSSHQMKVVSPSLTSCQTEAAMLCLRPAGWYWCVCFLHVAATTWKCLHLSVFSLHLHHRRTEPTASAPGTEAVEKWWYKFWMIVKYFIVEPPGWTEAVHLWFFYYYLWLLFITEQQLWSQHQCCYYNDKRRANCCCQHRLQLSQHTADCVTHTHMQPHTHTHTHTHTQWTVSSSLLMQKNICTSCFFFLPETLRTCFAKIIMMLNYCWIFNVDLIWWRHVGSILVPLTWTEVQYWSKWTLLLVSRLTRCCPLLAGGDTAAEAGQVKWTCECLHVSPGIIIQLSYLSWFIVFILFGHT